MRMRASSTSGSKVKSMAMRPQSSISGTVALRTSGRRVVLRLSCARRSRARASTLRTAEATTSGASRGTKCPVRATLTSSLPGIDAAMRAETEGGTTRSHVPEIDDGGCPHRAQRGLHDPDLAYQDPLFGHEAPPHLMTPLAPTPARSDRSGRLARSQSRAPWCSGPDGVADAGQQWPKAKSPAALRASPISRCGEEPVEDVQAVGAPDRTDEDEARHELGPARREHDGHAPAIAVAHHGDRRGLALDHDVGQEHLGVVGDAERLVAAAAVPGPVDDEEPVIAQALVRPGPSRSRGRAARGRRGPGAPRPRSTTNGRRKVLVPGVGGSADAVSVGGSVPPRRRRRRWPGPVFGSARGISTVNTDP